MRVFVHRILFICVYKINFVEESIDHADHPSEKAEQKHIVDIKNHKEIALRCNNTG